MAEYSDDLQALTPSELVNRCLDEHEPAWNEFFHRYTSLIKKKIIKTFISRNKFDLAKDQDVVQEIFLLVFEKLFIQNTLDQLEESEKVEAWLRTVSKNRTVDWLKKRGSQKNLPVIQATTSSLSLNAPIDEESRLSLADIIPDRNHIDQSDIKELKDVSDNLANLSSKKLWALRLKVLFYDPLDKDEIQALASFLAKPPEQVFEQVDLLMENLLKKKHMKDKDLNSAGRVWSLIRHLEMRLLNSISAGDLSKDEQKNLENEIRRRSKRLEILLRSGSQFIEPANEEIAKILGIPLHKVGRVSVLIHRARKKILLKQRERYAKQRGMPERNLKLV